jgi:hypothetical protein
METKKCSECRRTLPLEQFVLHNKRKSLTKRVASCKECRYERAEQWRKTNPQKVLEYSKGYRRKFHAEILARERQVRFDRRLLVLQHYSNGDPACYCCGATEWEFLTLDHVAENGSAHRKELQQMQNGRHVGWYIFKWLIDNGFPGGYQVLCFNCNVGKHRNSGICPHEVERRRLAIKLVPPARHAA